MSEPAIDALVELSQEIAPDLSAAVTAWVAGEDLGIDSWRRMMLEELETPLTAHLLGPYSDSLRARGISPVGSESVKVIVRKALMDTNDIRLTVLNAPEPSVVTAGAFSLAVLLSMLHQSRIVQSITRLVQDVFTNRSVDFNFNSDFTGRRRWRTSVVSSRHGYLNFQIAGAREGFQVGDHYWSGPRANISDANEASGCKCYLEYETNEGNWV